MNLLSFIVTWDPEYLGIPHHAEPLPTRPLRRGEFYAGNYYEAARRLDGTTTTSNVRSVVRTGHNRWRIEDR
jgi:hypothetical protein